MSLIKKIGANHHIRGMVCWLAASYLKLVQLTGRFDVVGLDIPTPYWDQGRPFILAFWHGRLLMMHGIWPRDIPSHMLVSTHRDGQLIARTIAYFRVNSIAGSSTRGGVGALRSILTLLKSGQCIGITPDGPRGPRMRASSGVISIARLSGCPIIPAAFSARRAVFLRTWDRFLIPWPFCRGTFIWGDPLLIPRDADDQQQEAYRLKLEQVLQDLTAQADQMSGQPVISPAPAKGAEPS